MADGVDSEKAQDREATSLFPAESTGSPDSRAPGSLNAFFSPRNVAVIGATDRPGSVGRTVLANLLAGPLKDRVHPVNSKHARVMGIAAVPDIKSISEPVDLAVVVTPASTVPAIIDECGEAGVPAAIVITAGFKEMGPSGAELENKIFATARRHGMRIVGPNCLGVMCSASGLNATFAGAMVHRGRVAFLSQSGALCTAILSWSLQENVGFSAFVSVGSMLDVGWGDLIDYFGSDPHTDSILLYMETVGNARAFLSAAREVALSKPIIVIKGGRTNEAAKAAASHTGSLAGSDTAFDAAIERVGVLRVERISDLFSMAAILAQQPRPSGRRLTIVTNAGGPGVLATDTLIQGGGELTQLSDETKKKLDEILPAHWSHNNPIDVLGDADADRYARTLEIAANDPGSDGLLVILTPQAMTDPLKTAEALRLPAQNKQKPLLASWMGGEDVEPALEVLHRASIPTFSYPDTAARAFNYLVRYSENLRNIYETPAPMDDDFAKAVGRISTANEIIAEVRSAGRTLLTEEESKRLLAAYNIPIVPTQVATSENQAVDAAEQFGFPVVLKLHSLTITHKTDVDGIRLDLGNAAQVREAFRAIKDAVSGRVGAEHFQGVTVQPMIRKQGYELILGSTLDPQFGPVIMFGMGGQLVEVLGDTAVTLPPLNATLARRLMKRTRIYKALLGIRGKKPVDLDQLGRTLIGFSNMLMEQAWIKECDINPLLASHEGVLALDARIVLHDSETGRVSPAIRPYPVQYARVARLKDGTPITVRPIRLEDEPLMVRFHQSLSDESVRRRYFQLLQLNRRIEHNRLVRVCYNDFDREIALVAERRDPNTSEASLIGVARLCRDRGSPKAEFAIIISDKWQNRGVGRVLLEQLIDVGSREGVQHIVGDILQGNWTMQALCKSLGFHLRHDGIADEVRASLDVRPLPIEPSAAHGVTDDFRPIDTGME